MTQQNFQSLLPPLSVKGQHHLLLSRGFAYLLPFTLLSAGLALGGSTPPPTVEPLPSLNESNASSTLESPEPSIQEEAEPALPDYDSVNPMTLNEGEAEGKIEKSTPKNEKKTALEPIAPLTNSSPTPEVDGKAPTAKPEVSKEEQLTPAASPEQPSTPENPQSETSTGHSPEPLATPKVTPTAQESTASETQNYVDLNGYPEPEPEVEISDRENNCTTVIKNGELVSGSCNLSQEETATAPQELPSLPTDLQPPSAEPQPEVYSTYTPPEELPPLQVAANGDTTLIFPLSQAVAVSSPFGWRNHPIHGRNHFHTGTDFAATEGTLVVAARSGKVAFTDYRQGYGLIVGLRHDDGKHESRYAHLSQIHVRPGDWVEQGTVVGRVGSTGSSTGPHLHFEWRVRKGHRWVATDATEPLLVARDNINANQIAFNDLDRPHDQPTDNHLFAALPQVLSSIATETASWMAKPELDFLEATDFGRAYERQAPLSKSAQLRDSALVVPISLPQALASLFNWEPPQLFAENNREIISNQAASKTPELAYRYPNSNPIKNSNEASYTEPLSQLNSFRE